MMQTNIKSKFQPFVEACQTELGKMLHSFYEDSRGGLSLQFDFSNGSETIMVPSFNYNGSISLDETIFTVLYVYINHLYKATFEFQGYLNSKGHYLDYTYVLDDYHRQPAYVVSMRIEEPEELIEMVKFIKYFVDNEDAETTPKTRFEKMDTNKVWSDLFVFVPQLSKKMILYDKIRNRYSIEKFMKSCSDRYSFNIDQNDFPTLQDFNEAWQKDKDARKLAFDTQRSELKSILEEGCTTPQLRDIFFNYSCTGYKNVIDINPYAEDFEPYVDSDGDIVHDQYHLYYVFRTGKKTSYLAFKYFLKRTIEGKDLINNLHQQQATKKITFISNYNASIIYTVEYLRLKLELKNKFDSLLNSSDNFELQNSLLQNRLKYVSDFYKQDHEFIQIFKDSMPYIIESAYRRFVKSAGFDEQLKCGQHLLNVLIKSRLFLPLEEFYVTSNKDLQSQFSETLFNSKPSDGGLQNLYNSFCKLVGKHNINFSCFGHLHGKLNNADLTTKLNELVELRNRFHHPPYDGQSFISMLKDFLPKIIPTYRDAFRSVDFIVSDGFTIVGGKPVLKAKKLMGFESMFDTIEREVPMQVVEKIETNALCAMNSTTGSVVRFSEFLRVENFEMTMIKVGFFDRVADGNRIFEFE